MNKGSVGFGTIYFYEHGLLTSQRLFPLKIFPLISFTVMIKLTHLGRDRISNFPHIRLEFSPDSYVARYPVTEQVSHFVSGFGRMPSFWAKLPVGYQISSFFGRKPDIPWYVHKMVTLYMLRNNEINMCFWRKKNRLV